MMAGIAIMSVDPGGKTGVAQGLLNAESDTVGAALRRARKRGSLKAFEVSGNPQAQGWQIANMWVEFYFRAVSELGCSSEDVSMVIEAFELRQRNVDLAPVEVTNALLALLSKKTDEPDGNLVVWKKTDDVGAKLETAKVWFPIGQPTFQKASSAMSFATNARLREWDAWVRGSEHMRDAVRHLAVRADQMLV